MGGGKWPLGKKCRFRGKMKEGKGLKNASFCAMNSRVGGGVEMHNLYPWHIPKRFTTKSRAQNQFQVEIIIVVYLIYKAGVIYNVFCSSMSLIRARARILSRKNWVGAQRQKGDKKGCRTLDTIDIKRTKLYGYPLCSFLLPTMLLS